MTTYTPAYKQNPNNQCANSLSIGPPPGSIMAYFAGGDSVNGINSDPDGWIICDGVPRMNGNDGRYNYLNSLGIGQLNMNTYTYTPPDLRGAFLRGAKRGDTTKYGNEAPNVRSSQPHATQTHTHGVNDPGHGHTFVIGYDGGLPGFGTFFRVNNTSARGQYDSNITDQKAIINPLIQFRDNITNITIQPSTTYVNANETRPYNFGVNWIMKL